MISRKQNLRHLSIESSHQRSNTEDGRKRGLTQVWKASRGTPLLKTSCIIFKQHLEGPHTIYPIKWKKDFDGYNFVALNPHWSYATYLAQVFNCDKLEGSPGIQWPQMNITIWVSRVVIFCQQTCKISGRWPVGDLQAWIRSWACMEGQNI